MTLQTLDQRPPHGGDVEAVAARYQLAVAELIDFSANINPLGPPPALLARLRRDAIDVDLLRRYPDAELSELRGAIASQMGVAETSLVIANGAAALIDAAVRAINPSRCLVPVPAFSEYHRALAAVRCAMLKFPLPVTDLRLDLTALLSALDEQRPCLCIITNPHNPSGGLLAQRELQSFIRRVASLGTIVMLDEAFIDYMPHESLIAFVESVDNLIVLRSLTKFYACPALRVGYAATNAALASLLRAHISSWPVTTLAANAVKEALQDESYGAASHFANERARTLLAADLAETRCHVFASAANFLLLRLPVAAPLSGVVRERLILEHRIVVRDCASYENLNGGQYIRVAVRSEADNKRLVAALRRVLRA